MTTETRSPHEIERDIERDRAELTENLETLQDRFSVDGMMRSVGDQLREHGGEIGASISRTVKENPAAVALTGIGLAWMIFGNRSERSGRRDYDQPSEYAPSARNDYGRRDAYERRTLVSRPDPRFKGDQAGLPNWARAEDGDDESYFDQISDAAESAKDGLADVASSAQDSLSDAASSAREGVSGAASSARDNAASAGSTVSSKLSEAATQTASSVGSMARAAQDRAALMKARIAEGTEALSEDARARVIAAREAAIDARRKAARAASAGAEHASDFYDSQPLVAGALAVALGAAIGGALPRTQKEDDLMGAHSDDLMREAERIFQEEREKARAVVNAAKDEARAVAKEKRDDLNRGAPGDKSAVEAVADEAKAAGQRVADAAEKKADEKGLGKISS